MLPGFFRPRGFDRPPHCNPPPVAGKFLGMSHGRRFICDNDLQSPPWILTPPDARHALKVLRLKAGDIVTLMDGRGGTRKAAIEVLPHGRVSAHPAGPVLQALPPSVRLHLFVAAPHPGVMDEIITHAVELAAWKILTAPGEHSQSTFSVLEKRLPRWRLLVRSACKQSGNPFFPELTVMRSFIEAVEALPRTGFHFAQQAPPLPPSSPIGAGDIALAVGPEGDFSPEERQILVRRGLRPAGLGPYTLRVDTAALSALAHFGPAMLRAGRPDISD